MKVRNHCRESSPYGKVFIYFLKVFCASLLIKFLTPEIAISLKRHRPFFIITEYDVRFIVREGSVSFHFLVSQYVNFTFITLLVAVDFGTQERSQYCPLSNFIQIALHMLKRC